MLNSLSKNEKSGQKVVISLLLGLLGFLARYFPLIFPNINSF